MAHLLCLEKNNVQTKSLSDPVLCDDERVLKNLMTNEERYTIQLSYFKCLQTDLKPNMRKIVASWMLEVCEEEGCENDIFPLAMNTLDRFLSIVKIRKSQFQLLGSVCLFLASKLRQSRPLSAKRLIFYTDNSITIDELMDWELLVLSRLKWDLAAVTPNDFLNVLLRRLHKRSTGAEIQMIKKHSQAFISLCASEYAFTMLPPSMIAAASICTAMDGLRRLNNNNNHWHSTNSMRHQLHLITGIEKKRLHDCQSQIEELMAKHVQTNDLHVPNEIENTSPQTPVEKLNGNSGTLYKITSDCSYFLVH